MSLKMANRIREFFRSMEFLDALPWHAVGQADAGVVPVLRVDRECAIARKPRVRGLRNKRARKRKNVRHRRRGREDARLFRNSPRPGRDREICRDTTAPVLRKVAASPGCSRSRERENPCPAPDNRAATGDAWPVIWNRLAAPRCPRSRPCAILPSPRKERRAVGVPWTAANAKEDRSNQCLPRPSRHRRKG